MTILKKIHSHLNSLQPKVFWKTLSQVLKFFLFLPLLVWKILRAAIHTFNKLSLHQKQRLFFWTGTALSLIVIGGVTYSTWHYFATQPRELTFHQDFIGGDGSFKAEIPGVMMSTVLSADQQGAKIQIARNTSSLEMTQPLSNPQITSKKGTATYTNAYQNVEMKYTLRPNGLKEDITLKQKPEKNVFATHLKLNNVVAYTTQEGTLVFKNPQGEYEFHFEQPYAVDAKGNRTYNVKYHLTSIKGETVDAKKKILTKSKQTIEELFGGITDSKFSDSEYILQTVVDPAWLNDPARAYPVTIDPTVTHNSTATFATGQLNRVQDTGSGSNPNLTSYYQELTADTNTIALWHMNEASNGTCTGAKDACDSSGNVNGGTQTSTTITTASQFLGTAARSFDGTNSFVTVANSSSLNLTQSQPFTLEAWVNTSALGADRYFFDKQENVTNELLYGLGMNSSNQFNFVLGKQNVGSNSVTSSSTLSAGTWYHVAGVSDGTTIQLYVNGRLEASTAITISASTQSVANLYLGELYNGASRWSGLIDEVRISNVARSAEEIKADAQRRPFAIYTSPVVDFGATTNALNTLSWDERGVSTGDGETASSSANLVGQWNFNATSGTTATNDAGAGTCGGTASNCDLTLSSFASTGSQDAAAGTGWTADNKRWGAGALMFDGTNDIASCTDANCGGTTKTDIGTGDFSAEAWIKTNQTANAHVMSKGTTADFSWQLAINGVANKASFTLVQTGAGTVYGRADSLTTVNDGQWHYIVGTWTASGTSIKIYVDGKLEATSTSTTGTLNTDSAANFVIGARGDSTLFFNGVIDVPRVYHRALPAHEILSNYNAGNMELQTRVGNTATPDDGTWEAWKPTTSETQIDSTDDPGLGTGIYDTNADWAVSNPSTGQNWVKQNNVSAITCDSGAACEGDGRLGLGAIATGSDSSSAYLPNVILDGSTYKMWYTCGVRICYATSSDGLTWTKLDNNLADNTTCDSGGACAGSGMVGLGTSTAGDTSRAIRPVVIKDGGTYKMWYTGYNGTSHRIFYATSPDGLVWTKLDNSIPTASNTTGTNGRIPLGASGGDSSVLSNAGVLLGSVIKDGSTYRLWYQGYDGTSYRVFNATSSDGLTWTKTGNTSNAASNACSTLGQVPVGTGTGDTVTLQYPTVIKDGLTYKMWYIGGTSTATHTSERLYYATSNDALVWCKQNNTAPSATDASSTDGRLGVGSSGDDTSYISGVSVLKVGGTYKMWYGAGTTDGNLRTFYATMTPIPESISRDTTVKTEGTASLRTQLGATQATGKTAGLWHLEESGGTGAYVKDSSGRSTTVSVSTGTGADGAITVTTSKNINTTSIEAGRPTCLSATTCADGIAYKVTAPADNASSVVAANTPTGIAANDEVLLINLGGTTSDFADVGNYEFKTVQSVASTTITFTSPITKSYDGTVAANQKVVVQRVPNYTSVTVSSGGTITASAWDGLATVPAAGAGYLTGIVAFRANGTVSVASGGTITTSNLGYAGGAGGLAASWAGKGESYDGTGSGALDNTRNLGGGGGGKSFVSTVNQGNSGGGGGYTAAPSNATADTFSGNATLAGQGGATYGDPKLGTLLHGSGGGGGGRDTGNGPAGGKGGGIIFIGGDTITVAGSISSNGQAPTAGVSAGSAGGGAGGSILLDGNTVTLGASLVTATGGAAGTSSCGATCGVATAGSVGRIRVETATTALTGTTSPSASTVSTYVANLTPSGSPTMTTGFFGKGMTFNGSSQSLTCTDANCGGTTTGLDPGSGSISVGAWVKTTNTTRQMIIAKGSSSGQFAYSLETGGTTAGAPTFYLYNNANNQYKFADSTVAISDNKWHYVVGAYDGTTIALYVDGVLVTSNSTAGSGIQVTDSTGDFFIGGRGGASYWNGSIDEPFVERRGLSADEVSEMYRGGSNYRISRRITSTDLSTTKRIPFWIAADRPGTYLESALGEGFYANGEPTASALTVGLYHMEDQAGTSAYIRDSSFTTDNLTPTGTTLVQGKFGKARSFNGTSDLMSCTHTLCGSTAQLGITNATISIVAWIKTTGNGETIVSKYNSGSTGSYTLSVGVNGTGGGTANKVSFSSFNGTTNLTVAGTTSVNDGNWHQVAVTSTSAGAVKIYVDGKLDGSGTGNTTFQSSTTANFAIGADYTSSVAGRFFNGIIDEVLVYSGTLSATDIRHMYDISTRTYPITIDFAATLDAGNLIANSADLSFTVNGQSFGATNKGDKLYYGDKIIIKENYNGTDYIAQGTVNAVTPSTGAVTVTAWDGGSTFPSGGFTTGASVFKWQREYWDITGIMADQRDTAQVLTIRPTDGLSGRNVYIDDFESAGDYLTTPGGSTITSSPLYRYMQYRSILSSNDTNVSPSLVSTTINYNANTSPTTPTLELPLTGQGSVSTFPQFKTTSTDPEGDYLRYKIQLCTDAAMTLNCQTFDQTSSQTGWSGQNTQTSTAYTSGTQGVYTVQTRLTFGITYYWRSYAIDPAGSNTFTVSSIQSFTTQGAAAPPSCTLTKNNTNTSILVTWTDIYSNEDNFVIEKNIDNAGFTSLTSPAANVTSYIDSASVSSGHTYQYRIKAVASTAPSEWCTTSTLDLEGGHFYIN